MPLSCKSGEKTICSIELDAYVWDELRSLNAIDNRLCMDCCGSQVTLKTSKLGTKFFAHKRRGTCTSAAETAEHLFVKARIAQAISETEWRAKTEVRAQASQGGIWVADVLATKGKHHIAFEVQWSPQTLSETLQRQSLYQDSNVRCLWLFKRPSDIQASKEVPSVLIEVTLDPAAAWVWIPIGSIGSYMRASCPISCDHIPRRSWAFFEARQVMRGVIKSFKTEQIT